MYLDMLLTSILVSLLALTSVHGGVLTSSRLHKLSLDTPTALRVPDADGLLHFFVLPVGQGDAHVIQCPNGDLSIVDLGTSDSESAGFWFTNEIVGFLQGQFHLIKNVILSHNHFDHYSFLPTVLTASRGLTGLTNIYVSCMRVDLPEPVSDWITSIEADMKLRLFNNGRSCGVNSPPCGALNLCPGDSSVQVHVMAANLENCANTNKNIDSVVFKIIHNEVTILFNGDFEDYTSNQNEDGPQKAMAEYYGDDMKVTVFKLAHHAAQNLANKRISCAAHAPKAIFVSGNTWYSYRHPRCDVIDRFKDEVQSLCKPLETNPDSGFYCGEYPLDNVVPDDKVQRTYACGENSTSVNGGFRYVTNNEYAIYSTVPEQNVLNIIEFSSDGTKWGFTNNFVPRVALDED